MPQAVKIVSQPEEQGLTTLCKQASARGTTGQLAFGHGEDGFNQRAATVFPARKRGPHLRSDTMNPPRLFPALGGDDAQGMQLLTDESVVTLGIELGVGQDTAHGSVRMGLSHQFGEMGAIVPWSLTHRLRQDELPLQIDDGQPLQPMPPRQGLLGVVIHAAHEECAHRARGKSGRIHRHLGAASGTGQRHAVNHLVQSARDRGFVQPPQETVQGCVIGNRAQPQGTAQWRVFRQSHLGFPVGPVLVTHQAQDGQQLRLRELLFAKRGAIPRHGGLSYLQSHSPESHQTHFGHNQQRFRRS